MTVLVPRDIFERELRAEIERQVENIKENMVNLWSLEHATLQRMMGTVIGLRKALEAIDIANETLSKRGII